MEIFETVKNNLASIGFVANQHPLHAKQLVNVARGFLALILQCLYLAFEANTDKEYMDSIFMTAVGIMIYSAHMSSIFKTASLFIFLDDLEHVVNERMSILFNFHTECLVNFYT